MSDLLRQSKARESQTSAAPDRERDHEFDSKMALTPTLTRSLQS